MVILDEVKRRLSELSPVIADLADALAIEQSKVRLDELENPSLLLLAQDEAEVEAPAKKSWRNTRS